MPSVPYSAAFATGAAPACTIGALSLYMSVSVESTVMSESRIALLGSRLFVDTVISAGTSSGRHSTFTCRVMNRILQPMLWAGPESMRRNGTLKASLRSGSRRCTSAWTNVRRTGSFWNAAKRASATSSPPSTSTEKVLLIPWERSR